MNTIVNNLSLVSVALFSVWLISGLFFHLTKINTRNRFILVLLIFALIRFVPIYAGMSTAQVLRGVLGDLSITTTLLILTFLYGEIQGNKKCYKINNSVWLFVFIIDLVLCLSVFGYIPIDIYSSGYFPRELLIFYLIMQILFWHLSRRFATFWLMALVGCIFKVMPSSNLWDYLIDPVLWLVSLIYLIIFGLRKLTNNKTPS